MKLIEKYFDEKTMSVHIKTDSKVIAKKWKPWSVDFCEITEKELTELEVWEVVKEIESYWENIGYFDQRKVWVSVLQIEKYRITITSFPLSEKTEITIVKPVKKLWIDDYHIDEKLRERFLEKAEWVLVAWAPWSWKSTFIQALINFYFKEWKIIKTLESPRDLQVPNLVTQYSLKHAEHDWLRDILLLARPDYVFFDEIRNHKDFWFYSDLRLSWIWMVWIVHATQAIDAIQRFVWKLDLWMIPSVIDTVVFIKNWEIEKVLTLKYEIRTPSWMEERDLARPIISISDLSTWKEEFEIYTFWEETVVMPIDSIAEKNEEKSILNIVAEKEMEKIFKWMWFTAKVKMKSSKKIEVSLPKSQKWKFIGQAWSNISATEKELWLSIDVRELSEEEDFSDFWWKWDFKKKKKFKKR